MTDVVSAFIVSLLSIALSIAGMCLITVTRGRRRR